ncbi:glycerol-3-phosphate responsive antiterminator [Tissierella creatinini]|nr:glycerol-3-phosphate responsive antiterminator [Tissierella creatinini]TJX66720.1 glycerol-3-phosphate responsive antiterminator [Soehngenia saccharolytica]
MSQLFVTLMNNPIIAAINNLDSLDTALNSNCNIIFLNTGNIFNLKDISNRVKSKNKDLYIYIDSIDGFSKDTWGLEYISKNIQLDGIITKKQNLVKLSKDMGIFTIEKIIIHDSITLENALATLKTLRPHAIELSPGILLKIIQRVFQETMIPIIASGLLEEKLEIHNALKAGAVGISSSNNKIWYEKY